MKKIFTLLFVMLSLSSVAFAVDEMEVIALEVHEQHWWERLFGDGLAIGTDKSVYAPGDVAKLSIGSSVPCNTAFVYLVIEGPTGTQQYYQSVGSLFKGTCFTAQITMYVSVPQTEGTYTVALDYKDATGKLIYRDSVKINVADPNKPVVCPLGSCSSWTNFQKYEHGYLQVKTCYTYSSAPVCKQGVVQTYRTNCDSGYTLVNNACVLPNNQATCGDLVVQTGESCDQGDENGACPSSCNSLCQPNNNCAALPPVTPPPSTPPPASGNESGSSTLVWAGVIGVVALAGGLIWKKVTS